MAALSILPGQIAVSRHFRIGAHAAARPYAKETFARIERVAELKRMRGPLVIETYGPDLLEGARREVLDNSPPPELQ